MKIALLTGCIGVLLSSVACQEEGYDYAPPPVATQLQPRPPRPQPIEAEGFGASKPQASGGGGHSHADSDDPLAWLRESVPGEPDVDYPILNTAPETSFSCADKADGMYADVEARCQPWHQCLGDRKWSFLCPNGTIFNQEIFTCVWWFDFDCESAEGFYSLNEGLYQSGGGGGGGEDYDGENNGVGGRPAGGNGGRPSGGDEGRPTTGGSETGGRPSGGRPSGGRPSGGRPSGGRPSGERPSGGRPSGGRPSGGGSQPGQILPVISEDSEDNLSGYEEENLVGFEEDNLSGYGVLSGPTPAPIQPDGLYGAPRVGRRRNGRREGKRRFRGRDSLDG